MKVDRLFQIAEVLQAPLDELCPKWLCREEQIGPRLYKLAKIIHTLPAETQTIFFCATEAMAVGLQAGE